MRSYPFLSDPDITYFLKQGGFAKDQGQDGSAQNFSRKCLTHTSCAVEPGIALEASLIQLGHLLME